MSIYPLLDTIMKTLVALLLLSSKAFATNRYVRSGATGANTRTNWNDAWPGWDLLNWPSVHPGDNIYVAGGDIASFSNCFLQNNIIRNLGIKIIKLRTERG
jgi:hypothetical protein